MKNLRAELGSRPGLPDGGRQPEAESQILGECFSHFKSFTGGGPRMDVGGKRERKAGVLFGVSPASHPCESCDWELRILGVFVFRYKLGCSGTEEVKFQRSRLAAGKKVRRFFSDLEIS